MSDRGMGNDTVNATPAFDCHRRVLISVAYRILGSMTDAEDVVQETWLRWSNVNADDISSARAYLVRVTTRLAIDRLRRVKARREAYVGPWLPEPVLTDDIAEDVVTAESVSLALLVVLETLSPLERAVFVLREAFAMSYAEIGEALERSEDAVRQLARRARDHVGEGAPRYDADQLTRRQVTARFLAATSNGDLEALMRVLAPGVTLVADGGGRVLSPRRPLYGATEVARFLVAVTAERQASRFYTSAGADAHPQLGVHLTQVNGEPGIIITADDQAISALVLGVDGDLVHTIHLIANPDKLGAVQDIEER